MTQRTYPTVEEVAMRIVEVAGHVYWDIQQDRPVTRDLDELDTLVTQLRAQLEQRHLVNP